MKLLLAIIGLPLFAQQLTISGQLTLTGQVNSIRTGPVNCVVSPAQNCPSITVSGDPYDNSGFSGYADPSSRTDPQTGTPWLCYSFPRALPGNGTRIVETHIAYWNGTGWTNSGLNTARTGQPGVLRASLTVNNPVTSVSNDQTSHEVCSILPFVMNGLTYWIGINSEYQVPSGGAPPGYSYALRQEVAICADTTGGVQGPMCLLNATVQYLGGNEVNTTYWPIAYNLSSLSGTSCPGWREPTMIAVVSGSTITLYLLIECSDLTVYHEFSTVNPAASPGTWTWSHVTPSSAFATSSDAAALCSVFNNCGTTDYLTQGEIALSFSNPATPVMCFDDVHVQSGNKIADGVACLKMASISPPAFAYSEGAPIVLASMTSSTSTPGGPGTTAYNPDLPGGVILAHKESGCTGGAAGCSSHGGDFNFFVWTYERP